MQTDIDSWDIRLATKQTALTRQFASLEVSLSKLQNQSSWLAGQINALSSELGRLTVPLAASPPAPSTRQHPRKEPT